MRRSCVFITAVVAIVGCSGEQDHEAATPHPPDSHAPMTGAAREQLDRLANDPTADRSDRAAAVFSLFKENVKPGDTAEQVRLALRHTGWVDEARLHYFACLGGWIPIDLNFDDRTYSLELFTTGEESSGWAIYIQLAGQSEWGKWYEDGVAFLRGKAGSMGESSIKAFTLCYPDGRFEWFLLP